MKKYFCFAPLVWLSACAAPQATAEHQARPDSPSPRASSTEPAPPASDSSTASAAPSALEAPELRTVTTEVQAEPAAPRPLPPGSKVLHIGDSFAGALGLPLGKRFEAEGVSSILKHTDASYLTTWAWEDALQKYIWRYNPDLVLVTLGANELQIVEPEQRERAIRKIISTIGERPCVWVAIPLWNGPQNGLLEIIRQHSSPCLYLDTNALMDTSQMPRIKDGIHPTASAREEWADVVLAWLKEQLAPSEPPRWVWQAPRAPQSAAN